MPGELLLKFNHTMTGLDLSQFGYRLALCGKVGKHYCSTKQIDILETLSFMICGSGCLSNPTNLKTPPEPLITFS